MRDVRDFLRTVGVVDLHVQVWCAAQCARVALPHAPIDDVRPRWAIEAAEKWAKDPTENNEKTANTRSNHAYTAYSESRVSSEANACYAAYSAVIYPYYTPVPAAKAADNEGVAYKEMLPLCKSQRWPLKVPTSDEVSTLPKHYQVAVDYLLDNVPDTDIPVGDLVTAYESRAHFRWDMRAYRAIAERMHLASVAVCRRATEILLVTGPPL